MHYAKDHPRRGFRPAYHDARAEGWAVNHKKLQRLWREEGLRVPQRRRRKRLGTCTTATAPTADAPNMVWAVDFQFDATTDGRPIKIVSIVDEHTRECLGGLVERSITADTLIDELDRLAADRGYPAVLRCDNGPELACEAMADWAGERVGLAFIPPGQPGATDTSSRSTPGPRRMPEHQHLLVADPSPGRDQLTGRRNTTTTDGTQPWATRPRPATLPPAPTDERLSQTVDLASSADCDRHVSASSPGAPVPIRERSLQYFGSLSELDVSIVG